MYIDCELVYSSTSAVKQKKRNATKNKFIQYLCFIVVDFIHSSHHRLKMSSYGLKKNEFRPIDLTCKRSTQPLRTRILKALNTSFWNDFWSKGDSSHFENSPSFQISRTWSDVFWINENFIHNYLPCLITEMAKVAGLVTRPKKYYIYCLVLWI